MIRRLPLLLLLAVLFLTGGWFVRRTPTPITTLHDGRHAGMHLTVTRESGSALDVATRAAEDFRAEGWTEAPVSTATFRLFTRGESVAAILAEDTPSGTRLTRLVQHASSRSLHEPAP